MSTPYCTVEQGLIVHKIETQGLVYNKSSLMLTKLGTRDSPSSNVRPQYSRVPAPIYLTSEAL